MFIKSDFLSKILNLKPDPVKEKEPLSKDNNKNNIFIEKSKDKLDKTLVGGYNELMGAMEEVKIEIKKANSNETNANKPEVKTDKAEEKITYTIKKADTLTKIAKKYSVSVDDLKKANPHINPKMLYIGDKIVIPSKTQQKDEATTAQQTQNKTVVKQPKLYTVKSGDSLWKIAESNNISVEQLKKANKGITNNLSLGQKLVIPDPKFNSDMKIDETKKEEYKNAIEKMMKARGIKDTQTINTLKSLITEKSLKMKVDPVLIAGIIDQEVNFKYMSDNIWGINGKGMMQLTKTTIDDIYRLKPNVPAYYVSCKKDISEIMKKYPTANSLYNAICQKGNYELNLEVGIIIFKGKLEYDYMRYTNKSEEDHVKNAVRNYNGNVKKRASGIEIRDEYRNKIIANYDRHKLA